MKYSTRFEPGAQDDLRSIAVPTARLILRKLTELETDPYAFGTTALVNAAGVRRLRVGDYRILYTVEERQLVIWVVQVAHRSTIYRR